MPEIEDKRPRCAVCDEPYWPSRFWQRYCSPYCCQEFHRREYRQMRECWKAQQREQQEAAQ